jgi:hypothetical protein
MLDDERETEADEETLPDTSLHAYAEGRTEDIAGDGEKLQSNDPQDMQQSELDDEESEDLGLPAPEKH